MSSRLPAVLLALAVLSPLAAAQPAVETVLFAQEIKARLDALADALGELDDGFAVDLEALRDALAAGTASPAETHLALFERINALDAGVAAALAAFTSGVEQDASSHLQALVVFPNAFAVGDGGLIDAAARKALKLRVRSTVANFKRVRTLAKALLTGFAYDLIVDRRGQVLEPMTPSDDPQAEAGAPALVLRVDLLMSGSTKGIADDGVLCLAGTADPDAAPTVNMSIALPGGATLATDVAIDALTGRWSVAFPAALPGTLPEGNWQITLTQGAVALTDSLAVQ